MGQTYGWGFVIYINEVFCSPYLYLPFQNGMLFSDRLNESNNQRLGSILHNALLNFFPMPCNEREACRLRERAVITREASPFERALSFLRDRCPKLSFR
jgi:hypothetical protein